MLRRVRIVNYKSIEEETFELGRVNVFIGENGAGKSSLLEAIALAGAADAGKLDNEFLLARGVRVTEPGFMRSAFVADAEGGNVEITINDAEGVEHAYSLANDGGPYSSWSTNLRMSGGKSETFHKGMTEALFASLEKMEIEEQLSKLEALQVSLKAGLDRMKSGSVSPGDGIDINIDVPIDRRSFSEVAAKLAGFIIYSPENTALRMFERDGQIEPLGINGEGLLKLLKVMSQDDRTSFDRIRAALKMLIWFEDFRLAEGDAGTRMDIIDRFLDPTGGPFDQRSANEGFLFITFFFALFSSALTPSFFAVDNIDASLNPRLCQAMTEQLAALARASDKQVLLTTHQPAILDGLDLNDDEQRLFVVSRTTKGRTKIKRFRKPPPGGFPRRLSELFLEGAIGGVPKGL